jgi:hypothetical protein
MSQKYRQRGYMDYEHDSQTRKPRTETPQVREQPQLMTIRTFKCSLCGQHVKDPSEISLESRCVKCGSDLRSCLNCNYFDPTSRFQCMKDVTVNISPKDKKNSCTQFFPKTTLEKKYVTVDSQPQPQPQRDARKAFESLFKNS